ncbi:single-stranded-DNA-specific exonuclease RecJ [Duncaniella freteri]|jgi:single-stranded-DNA-specific exonuclease|uniref:Single-stranded-DNA-specific exonuclease RecJ n=10 Tax=Duncaniella TaxID=2518495 RepID=A0A4Z0VA45_9BACT|nr:single-stranded-DNA-specific exonuclease RecJ [Duncaniella freteri]MDE7027494.1 single-stranded-DNA-specific exonuclease RecJ [Duncaniella freteri]TGG40162.1 single-stranded-DNA-specific exonuclease RecJ [Duncaniella freteri]
MTSKWNYCPLTSTEQEAESRLAQRYSGTPPISELLAERGISTVQEAERFFHPSLKDLHDPFMMSGMDRAVNRLNRAMGGKEKIMVYGDYDVDGTTAVALVYKYLRNYYSNIEYYIPTRTEDGYGISRATIDMAAENGVTLFIILDCGIKATDEVAYARTLGIDFIICDHHVADEVLPPAAAILNPKLEDSTYPCPHLSGCGVGYKLMQAFAISNSLPMGDLEGMLDLVAVSIAADIVPMVGENRILTYFGLKRLNSNPNMGLRAIIRTCGLSGKEITISDVIFKIGPRINASGRMQSGKEAVDLLVSRDSADAFARAKEIDGYNQDRKELDKQITEEANTILEERDVSHSRKKSIVIYNKNWHKGIIGIVASRLTELYYKPTVVLTHANGLATGSSRSVQGFDVYSAVESTRDLLENFGGHTYAVGLSLKEENIPEFTRRFEEYVNANIRTDQLTPLLDIDAYLTFSEITPEFLTLLRKFNPFGPGNTKPIFCTRRVTDFGTSKLVGKLGEHIKLEVVDDTSGKVFNGIAFNSAEYFDHIHSGKPFDICYTIEENKRKGSQSVQFLVKAISIS